MLRPPHLGEEEENRKQKIENNDDCGDCGDSVNDGVEQGGVPQPLAATSGGAPQPLLPARGSSQFLRMRLAAGIF